MKTVLCFFLFFISAINAQNWVRVEGTGTSCYSAAINPHNKNTIWFGGEDNTLYVSYDGGLSADRKIQIPDLSGQAFPIPTLYIHPADTNIIFASSFNGSFKSTDYGITWSNYLPNTDIGFNGESITSDPLHPDTLYIGLSGNNEVKNHTFFRSFNRGITWDAIDMKGHRFCSITALEDGSLLGGNYEKGVMLRSTDNGSTWDSVYYTPADIASEIPKVTYDPNNPEVVWAAVLVFNTSIDNGYLIKSTDYGKTWTEIRTMGSVNPWAIDINNSGRIIVGMFVKGAKGAYISDDNGESWKALSSGLPESDKFPLVWMIKSNEDSLGVFICDSQYGAFKLNNTVVSVKNDETLPDYFALQQNYPNPFNPSTTISFSIPETGDVKLIVYDILGNEISTLIDGEVTPGSNEIVFNAGSNISSGVYFYRLEYNGRQESKSFVLLK